MAYTQQQVDKMREAIASGALSVEYGDKKVTYRSLKEMQTTLAQMEAEVAGKPASRRMRASFSKGIQ